MFSKTKRRSGLSHDTPDGSKVIAPPSLISPSLRIVGNLRSQGEVQIDGTVDGDVLANTLIIAEKGTINGESVADDVVVRGRVNGRIRAGKVQLAKSAHVVGEIRYNMLSIDSDAFVEGHCKQTDEPIEITEPPIKPAPQATRGAATILERLDPPHPGLPAKGANTWPDPTTRHRQVVAATTIRVGLRKHPASRLRAIYPPRCWRRPWPPIHVWNRARGGRSAPSSGSWYAQAVCRSWAGSRQAPGRGMRTSAGGHEADVLKPGARSYAIPVAVEVRQAGARSAARNDPGIAGDPR